MKSIYKRIALIITTLLVSVGYVFGNVVSAYADDSVPQSLHFDDTNVMDDLNGMTVNGKAFDISDWGFDTDKETTVFSLVEYCYSFYGNLQGNYGLYIYIWNPQGLKFNVTSDLNTISLRVGNDTSKKFIKYRLKYLSRTELTNYEGLFYKFKVVLSNEQLHNILDSLDSTERVYEIGEVELLQTINSAADNYSYGYAFKFSGYAAGYGPDENAQNTLKSSREERDILSLTPVSTVYRPEGYNEKGKFVQDSLHSVYFAVPNGYENKYGNLSAVHAQWLDAVLKPALVTGNSSAFSAILSFLGRPAEINTSDIKLSELRYGYVGNNLYEGSMGGSHRYGDFIYNARCIHYSSMANEKYPFIGDRINMLYLVFFSGNGTDSADTYSVPSKDITGAMEYATKIVGGEKVLGRYSKAIFESVADKYTEVNWTRGDSFDLRNDTITQNFWQRLFHEQTVIPDTDTFSGIPAIYPVKSKDLVGTKKEVCDRLYISEGDYDEFKSYFNDPKNADCTIYLFRYQVSDYISQEATLIDNNVNQTLYYYGKEIDTNAYFFKETVNLGFDIIDVTFSNGIENTVIPVAMKPIDVTPGATPPLETESDKWKDWLRVILGVVLLILLIVIVSPILPYVVKAIVGIINAIWWVLTLPFKTLAKLFKRK